MKRILCQVVLWNNFPAHRQGFAVLTLIHTLHCFRFRAHILQLGRKAFHMQSVAAAISVICGRNGGKIDQAHFPLGRIGQFRIVSAIYGKIKLKLRITVCCRTLCSGPILCHPVDDSFSRSFICFNLQNKSFVILSVLTILRIARKRGTAFWYGRTLHRRPFHTAF